ncbi:MAG: hypothetical protein GX600_11625 [Dehalococcoidia bacterium]|nr:hypothetical protein [Dehalococcoidia bacterium]
MAIRSNNLTQDNTTRVDDQCALVWDQLTEELRERYSPICTDEELQSLSRVAHDEALRMFEAAGLPRAAAEEEACAFAVHAFFFVGGSAPEA